MFGIFKQNKRMENPEVKPIMNNPNTTGTFSMTIKDVFTITGRGTVVTGKIDSGSIRKNDQAQLVSQNETKNVIIKGIESFRKQLDIASAGEDVGILLKDIKRSDVKEGDILRK